MQDIDFLPIHYRQQHVRLQSRPWQIVVVVAFGTLVGIAAAGQYRRASRAEAELAAVEPTYELAFRKERSLAEARSQLQQARYTAELFTYVRHPWPRTQLLAAVLAPLPDEITFDSLQISREKVQPSPAVERRPPPDKSAEIEAMAKLSPAQRDLKHLRETLDNMRTVIHLSGATSDSAALHRYVADLAKCELLAKVKLDSLGSTESKNGASMQFHITLVVCPGYGQPNGPARAHQPRPAETAQN